MSESDNAQVHIIGFSLGAMTALKIAAHRPNKVAKLTLIAPAAPLETGDYLSRMAGKPVFKAAQKGPTVFKSFTALQRLGLRFASQQIISTMFADSPEADKNQLKDPQFEKMLRTGLRESFGKNRQAYEQAVLTYVKPWSDELIGISAPVTIYHGTEDNWAPIEMAYALQNKIASDVKIIPFDGLGHYSVLEKAFRIALGARDIVIGEDI